MQIEGIFENIVERIQQEIKGAKSSIFIGFAWFTNQTLFDELVKQANNSCNVSLIISNNLINLNSSINYEQLNIGNQKAIKLGMVKKNLCIINFVLLITM